MPATVHGFTLDQPISAKGKFALARALLAEGDRDGAARLVREAWRSEELLDRTESDAYDAFKDLLTSRRSSRPHGQADRRQGSRRCAGARRSTSAATQLAIVKACGAVRGQSSKAEGHAQRRRRPSARSDLGYTLCRIQWLLAKNRIDDAARVMIAAAPETMALQDTDQWWRERRILSRKLLDQGEFQAAYRRDPAARRRRPTPTTGPTCTSCAAGSRCATSTMPAPPRLHFAHIDEGQTNPTVLARGAYWRGQRAPKALGQTSAAMQADYRGCRALPDRLLRPARARQARP